MLWVAALLALIIWVLGLTSGFLGFGIHIFLLAALIAGLAALLPPAHEAEPGGNPETDAAHASSVPASAVECAAAATTGANDERDAV